MITSYIPRRRLVFVLTPLIDVIFLLLIFFMLSSQIAPYSLMPIGRVAAGEAKAPAGAAQTTTAPMALRVSRGIVGVGGEQVPMDAFRAAVDRLKQSGVGSYVVIPGASADVQDIVTVLETLQGAAAQVTLLNPKRPAP